MDLIFKKPEEVVTLLCERLHAAETVSESRVQRLFRVFRQYCNLNYVAGFEFLFAALRRDDRRCSDVGGHVCGRHYRHADFRYVR